MATPKVEEPQGPTFVCGVLNDIHSLGLFILMQALRLKGYNVVNLGTMVTAQEFVEAARETAAKAILVSNSSGMAEHELGQLVDACAEAGVKDVLIYAGGMLTLHQEDWPETKARLEGIGITRAFPPGSSLDECLAAFADDLSAKRTA